MSVLADRFEKYLDSLTPRHVPHSPSTPHLGHIQSKPMFQPLRARDLDRIAGEIAHVRQLTYDSMIAQMAIDESKSRLDTTSACYNASCLHAEKFHEALKLATINLNLRQGQANSPDFSDFATTVVHDPADHDFMGGEPIPQERNETPIMATRPVSPPVAPLAPPSSSYLPLTPFSHGPYISLNPKNDKDRQDPHQNALRQYWMDNIANELQKVWQNKPPTTPDYQYKQSIKDRFWNSICWQDKHTN